MTHSIVRSPARFSLTRWVLLGPVLSLFLGAASPAMQPLTAADCAKMLISRVQQKPGLTPLEQLPSALDKRGSATLMIRVPLPQTAMPVSELQYPGWAADNQVQYLADFAAIQDQAWYLVVAGSRTNLLATQSQLLEKFSGSQLYFEILGSRSSTGTFELPTPNKMIEIMTVGKGASSALEKVLPSGEAAVLYEAQSASFLFALPANDGFTLSSLMLGGLRINQLTKSSETPLLEVLKSHNANESFVVQHKGLWIVSQTAFSALKQLEGKQQTAGAETVTNTDVFSDLQQIIANHVCPEEVCEVPLLAAPTKVPRLAAPRANKPAVPSPAAIEPATAQQAVVVPVVNPDVVLLSHVENGLLKDMLTSLRGGRKAEGRINMLLAGALAQNLAQVAKTQLQGDALTRVLTQLENLKSSDGGELFRGAAGSKAVSPTVLSRFIEAWRSLALELDPDFKVSTLLSAENIRKIMGILNAPAAEPVAPNAPKREKVKKVEIKALSPRDAARAAAKADPDFQLLAQIDNGLLKDMMATLVQMGGHSWSRKESLQNNLETTATRLFALEVQGRLVRSIQTIDFSPSDGDVLGRMLLGNGSPAPLTLRLVDGWKMLAHEMDPAISLTAPLTAESIRSTIAKMATGEMPTAGTPPTNKKGKAAEPVVEDKKDAKIEEGDSLSGDDMKLIVSLLRENTSTSWWTPGNVQPSLAELFKNVMLPQEMRKIDALLTSLDFRSYDAIAARTPSKAQRKVLMAVRLLANVVAPELGTEPMSASWVRKLTRAYERQLTRMEKGKPGLELLLAKEPDSGRPAPSTLIRKADLGPVAGSANFIANGIAGTPQGNSQDPLPNNNPSLSPPQAIVRMNGPLTDMSEILFDANFYNRGFDFMTTADFYDFMLQFGYLGAKNPNDPNERDIVYFRSPNPQVTKVTYRVEKEPGHPGLILTVTAAKVINKDEEDVLYARIAQDHAIRPLNYTLPGGKSLSVAGRMHTAIKFSSKVMAKLIVKHRLSVDDVTGGLALVKRLTPGENTTFETYVDFNSKNLHLIVIPVDGFLSGKSLIPKARLN